MLAAYAAVPSEDIPRRQKELNELNKILCHMEFECWLTRSGSLRRQQDYLARLLNAGVKSPDLLNPVFFEAIDYSIASATDVAVLTCAAYDSKWKGA